MALFLLPFFNVRFILLVTFQRFTRKHCLQIFGLRMRSVSLKAKNLFYRFACVTFEGTS